MWKSYRRNITTAWLLNLAHAINWHKTEAKILPIILFLSPTLVDFHIPNKEIKMMIEIIKISSAIPVCKLCQFEALISCRNYIIAH